METRSSDLAAREEERDEGCDDLKAFHHDLVDGCQASVTHGLPHRLKHLHRVTRERAPLSRGNPAQTKTSK